MLVPAIRTPKRRVLAVAAATLWLSAAAPVAVADDAAPAEASVAATSVTPPNTDPEQLKQQRIVIRHRADLVFAAGIVAVIGVGIILAKSGRTLPIRSIPGLMVFEEAVARATEMGRPTLFTCGGACDLKRIQLFGSMPLLRRIASLSGELGNRLIVPVCYPETLSVHSNTIRDGYVDADALDMYRSEDVRFFPGGQFFFAIASMGWMLREQPATCFYFGHWEADSLMFAETGQTINAMQIAGTDQLYQVPFFVAACDYTIIGEEFWAASAEISRDPPLLGCLGGQDALKTLIIGFIVIGTLLCTLPSVAAWLASIRSVLASDGAGS